MCCETYTQCHGNVMVKVFLQQLHESVLVITSLLYEYSVYYVLVELTCTHKQHNV